MSSRNIADGISLRAQNNDSFDFENLKIKGEVVLRSSDLAVNGGTVPEVDRSNFFVKEQNFESVKAIKAVRADGDISLDRNLDFNSESLDGNAGFNVRIGRTTSAVGNVSLALYNGDGTNNRFFNVSKNDGVFVGNPTGLFKGPGIVNAEALYDNGDRVYSPNNKPTNSDVNLDNVTNDAQLKQASNLSDLNNVSTARNNLNLGNSATRTYTISSNDPSGGSSGDVHYQV